MRKKVFFLAAMSLAVLASCTQEDGEQLAPTSAVQTIHVVPQVSSIHSRGTYDSDNLSEFGISIRQGDLSVNQYRNVKMTKGYSSWQSEKEMIWSGDVSSIDVIAYAPYQANTQLELFDMTDYPVSVKQVQTADDKSSDFLVFKAKNYEPDDGTKGGKNVEVTFQHAMSQVNITLDFGNEFTNALVADVSKIEHFKMKAGILSGTCDFTLDEPKVTVSSGVAADFVAPEFVSFQPIDADHSHITAKYSCILVPQIIQADDFWVAFTIGDKNYAWYSKKAVTLEQGKAYDLKLTLGKDLLLLDGLNSTPWSENGWSDESNLD